MYFILAAAGSAFIALMVVTNGQLTEVCDIFAATTFIHITGLIFISLVLFTRKENPWRLKRAAPLLFTGGAIGVCTTMFNNAAFGKISVSAILALGLFAQAMTSLIIDQFGLFHMPVRKFNRGKLFGFLCTMVGIIILLGDSDFAWPPVILSLLAGVSVVTSRSINAELAELSSPLISTWHNYAVGFCVSMAIWACAVSLGHSAFALPRSGNPLIYMGGLIGVGAVLILNLTVKKMPAFILTLMMFAGQLFTGILLDFLLGAPISFSMICGGVLTVSGLVLNLWFDRAHTA